MNPKIKSGMKCSAVFLLGITIGAAILQILETNMRPAHSETLITKLIERNNVERQCMKISGVHHIEVSEEQLLEAIEIQWGSGLTGKDLDMARSNVQDHFKNLYLIQIELDKPLSPDFDWGDVTQEISGVSRENWQVPYDERQLDEAGKRWAFFFHFLDLGQPLKTPCGNLMLPNPTPMPEYLANVHYELP